MDWIKEHSLGLFCIAWMIVGAIIGVMGEAEMKDWGTNIFGDAFGATLVVLGTKRLRERGSAESK